MPLGFLLLQHRVAPGLEPGETLVERAGDAAIQPHRGARDAFQQPAIVADHHDAGAHAGQFLLQPLDAGQVQMVGRLVEQQDIGRGRQHLRERGATGLAAGQRGGLLVTGQAELLQQVAGAVSVLVGVADQTGLRIGQRGGEAGQVRLLRQIADGGAGLGEAAAGIRLDQAGGDTQQGGFARAVAADQAQPVARPRRPVRRRPAAGEVPKLRLMSWSRSRGGGMAGGIAR